MKIMVIDSHVSFREGITSMLDHQPDMQVVAWSDVSSWAVQKAIESRPDIILMDSGFAHAESIRLMKQVLMQLPEVSFIVLSTQDSDQQFYEMIRNGAKGYLPKSVNKTVLLSCLRALGRGEAAIPRNLMTRFLDEFARLGKLVSTHSAEKDLNLLTSRELEVLKILGQRASNREIATELGISENTVRVHVGSILGKLGLRNRREACNLARQNDLFDSALPTNKPTYENQHAFLQAESRS